MNPTFTLAPATTADVLAVLEIINHAKAFLKEVGWVLKADHQVVGYAAGIVGEDPNYQEIDGAWQNTTAPYATIHRIAISNQYRGQHLGQRFFKLIIDHFAGEGVHNFRVDTFKLNQPMQHVAKSAGFEYRGINQGGRPG